MKPRVVIIHPFVQDYRQALYARMAERLDREGFRLVVVWNQPAPRLRARGNAIEAPWTQRVPARWIEIGSRDLALRRLGALDLTPDDLVIVEQAVKNLETYPLLADRYRPGGRSPGIAMWGHGRSFSTPQSAPLAAFKQWLTRRCGWFFAYTQSGADFVIDRGFDRSRVTVLRNTIDTDGLSRDLAAVDDVDRIRADIGLNAGCSAMFLGGVDRAKGIDFLLDSAHRAASDLPGFSLVIAGRGEDLPRVERYARKGAPIRVLGRVEGMQKAQALSAVDVLAIPEWIGLVAVDSLVAGRPIVSTRHGSHAPERDYLIDGETAIFTEHDPEAYAMGLTTLLRDRQRLAGMQEACRSESHHYSLDQTVDHFVDGILAWASRRSESRSGR